MNRTTGYALLLLVVGSTQMIGEACGSRALQRLGAATAAAPAPRVFSVVRGLETWSTRLFVEWRDALGVAHSLEVTPEVGSRLRGPFDRRNVYGAALAYGPVLAMDPSGRQMLAAVLDHGLTGACPLLAELGVDPGGVRDVTLRYEPLPGSSLDGLPTRIPVPLSR